MDLVEKAAESLLVENPTFNVELGFLLENRDHYVRTVMRRGVDIGRAEDFVQDAYIKLIRYFANGRQCDPTKSIRALFNAILKNLAIDFFRRESGKTFEIPENTSCADDVEQNVRNNRAREKILQAIDRLSDPRERNVVIHRLAEELSSEETAGVLGIKSEQVNLALFQARAKLRKILGKEFENLV
jgi:RNA polymerase sigma factor (sigma-70 family)